MTKSVGSRELKNRLGTYLQWVRDGVTIIVTDRGRPVAELRPLSSERVDLGQRLEALAAQGMVTLPKRSGLEPFEPLAVEGHPLSETVVDDREDRF